VLVAGIFFPLSPARAAAPIDWNDGGIEWKSYDEGVALAKTQHRPICLVLYGEWCPHCHNFSRVFHDERVVELSHRFIMVHADIDREPAVNRQFNPDGAYVPRTFFLTPQGELRTDIHENRSRFLYFYDESSSAGILRAMEQALRK
jgi:hypothetical protein